MRKDECCHDLNVKCPQQGNMGLSTWSLAGRTVWGVEEPLGGGVQLEEEVSLTQPSPAHTLVGIPAWDGQTLSVKGLPDHGRGF